LSLLGSDNTGSSNDKLFPVPYSLVPVPCSLFFERPISLSRPYVVGFSRMGRKVLAAHRGMGTV
jgi:hypothetical protein